MTNQPIFYEFFRLRSQNFISCSLRIKIWLCVFSQIWDRLSQLTNYHSPKSIGVKEKCDFLFILYNIIVWWPVFGKSGDEEGRSNTTGIIQYKKGSDVHMNLHLINKFPKTFAQILISTYHRLNDDSKFDPILIYCWLLCFLYLSCLLCEQKRIFSNN